MIDTRSFQASPHHLKGQMKGSMQNQMKSQMRGFTLIEVMVVVVILAILATVVVPRIMDRSDDARIAKAQQDIRQLDSALKRYRLDNLRYPTTDQGLEALV